MDYQSFKKTVEERIISFMPEDYGTYQVKVTGAEEGEEGRERLYVFHPQQHERGKLENILLGIDLPRLYEAYQMEGNLGKILAKAAAGLDFGHRQNLSYTRDSARWGDLREQVVLWPVNRKRNQRLLERAPYQELLDLAGLYRIVQISSQGRLYAMTLTYDMQKELQLEEDELKQLALENTKRLFQPRIMSLKQAGAYAFGRDCFSHRTCSRQRIFVLATQQETNGASLLFYENILGELSERMRSGYYIIPASPRQLFAVSDQDCSEEKAFRLLALLNREFQEEEGFLSEHIYHYQEKERDLILKEKNCFLN